MDAYIESLFGEDSPDDEPTHQTYKTLSDARSASTTQQVVIQAITTAADGTRECLFHAYPSAGALEQHRPVLMDASCVRECIDPTRQRLAFVDVDSLLDTREDFQIVFGIRPDVYHTTKGYHLVGDAWLDPAEHKRLLKTLADRAPDCKVDVGATSSLRLAGTWDKHKQLRKDTIQGRSLNDMLVQPFGAEKISGPDALIAAITIEPTRDVPDDLVQRGVAAITNDPGDFLTTVVGCKVHLDRLAPGDCLICGSRHDNAGGYLVVYPQEGTGMAYCHRSDGQGVYFAMMGGKPDDEFPGMFEPRDRASEYLDPAGVSQTLPGSYIDGSPCAMGKSGAAWATIPEHQSVLAVSYRRTFSAAEAAKRGCQLYSDLEGPIEMTPGRRVMIQYDSLPRVVGRPDVVLLDELHGIGRQAMGQIGKVSAFKALVNLIRFDTRVIALDAYANDSDVEFLKGIAKQPIGFVRNIATPHADRKFYSLGSPKEWRAQFEASIAHRIATMTIEDRMADRVVVCLHSKAEVEDVSRFLSQAGVVHRAYHGLSDQVVKRADFENHKAAWADSECIVYNSALEAGVSVEEKYWRTCWASFIGLGTCEAAIQSLHRFRNVKTYIISATRSKFGGGPTTRAGLIEHLQSGKKYLTGVGGEVATVVGGAAVVGVDLERNLFTKWFISTQLEENRSHKYWPFRFRTMLKQTGFVDGGKYLNLEAMDTPAAEHSATPFENPLSTRTADADVSIWQDLVGDAGTEDVVQDLTADEIHSREKNYLIALYGLDEDDVSPELVDVFGKPKLMKAYGRLRRLRGATTHRIAVDGIRHHAASSASAYVPIRTTAEQHEVALSVLEKVGLDGIFDEGRITGDQLADGLATISDYRKIRRLWPDIRTTKDPTTTRARLGAVNSIIAEMFGAKLKATTTKRTHYTIVHEAWPQGLPPPMA